MRGGYRQNAGRKQGYAAKSAEEARKVFAEMISKEIEPIAQALIKRAKNGDVSAAKELFDRAWGKVIPTTVNPEENYLVPVHVMRMDEIREKYS